MNDNILTDLFLWDTEFTPSLNDNSLFGLTMDNFQDGILIEYTNIHDNGLFNLFPPEQQQQQPQTLVSSRSSIMLHEPSVAPYTTNQLVDAVPHIQFSLNEENKLNHTKGHQQKNKINIHPGNSIKKKTKSKKKKQLVDPSAPPKPKRVTGLDKPLILSSSLAVIMNGDTELSRPEIVKRLWDYIKSNKLQDPADRRYILCDEKLKTIFHQDRVNSFGMNKDLTAHLTKKEETNNETLIHYKGETQPLVIGDFFSLTNSRNTRHHNTNDHVLK